MESADSHLLAGCLVDAEATEETADGADGRHVVDVALRSPRGEVNKVLGHASLHLGAEHVHTLALFLGVLGVDGGLHGGELVVGGVFGLLKHLREVGKNGVDGAQDGLVGGFLFESVELRDLGGQCLDQLLQLGGCFIADFVFGSLGELVLSGGLSLLKEVFHF